MYSGWAPAQPRPPVALQEPPPGWAGVAEVIDRSIWHGDEHVIKFTDTAVEAFQRTGDPDTLAAATRAATLLPGTEE